MSVENLLEELLKCATSADAIAVLEAFLEVNPSAKWHPLGNRPNNRGIVEVSANPGRALVERVTNAVDAVLELEHGKHAGRPVCRSPRQAAQAWMNVPADGLSELSTVDRRNLAKLVTVHIRPGSDVAKRIVSVTDRGIGLSGAEMPSTILSLNESNKVQKPYLAGTYGQGGSATFASSELTVVVTRRVASDSVSFTVVRYDPPPADSIKGGSYVYLVVNDLIPTIENGAGLFEPGTMCLHFGYDLTKFPSPLGPNSVYGLLQQVAFDPVLPIWLDDEVHRYRRVIKGSRNALNGAVDDEDESSSKLSHHMPMFFVSLGDYGRAGIEYWVLEQTKSKTRPTASYVDPNKPIILTLNGQNQAEMTVRVIRKDAELPYLANRIICHIDCNSLTPVALRKLFVSSREEARGGSVLDLLEKELVSALRSDDELTRLNQEARDQRHREQDEEAEQTMRREVGRLLKLQGFELLTEGGAEEGGDQPGQKPKKKRKGPRKKPDPIPPHEPPTFIRIVWPEYEPIDFYADVRRYVRIETDANATYHDPKNPGRSGINIVVEGDSFSNSGSTPLKDGRMRAVVAANADATTGSNGRILVELHVPGRTTLTDSRNLTVIAAPPSKPSKQQIVMPPFEVRPVEDQDDPMWNTLCWPDDANLVASAGVPEEGRLIVYYSRIFPYFGQQFDYFEGRDAGLAASFEARYKIWLAVHSLILDKGQEDTHADEEVAERMERSERCRMATIAAMFAAAEAQRPDVAADD